MSDRTEALVSRLRQREAETLALFHSLAPDQWRTTVYTEGATWDVRTLLSHLVSSEQSLLRLYKNIQEGGAGVADDFDIDRYNASRAAKFASLSAEELLPMFTEGRAAMIAFVSGLTDDDLDREGRHATEGIQTLENNIKIVYQHNKAHEADLRRALGLPEA